MTIKRGESIFEDLDKELGITFLFSLIFVSFVFLLLLSPIIAQAETIAPYGYHITPVNWTYNNTLTVNFTMNFTDETALDSAIFYLWNATDEVNSTFIALSGGTDEQISLLYTFALDGYYNWSAIVNDTSNNVNWTEEENNPLNINWTLIMTGIAPETNITFPENITYNSVVADLNYTVFDAVGLDVCWYSTDSGTTNSSSQAAETNFTGAIGVTSVEGTNNFTLWCNDTAGEGASLAVSGNEQTASVIFIQDTKYPTFSNYLDDNASFVGTGTGNFSVDIIDTNGTVFLFINNSNYTAEEYTTGKYNTSVEFDTNDTWSYYWISYSNFSQNQNTSEDILLFYTINNSADTTAPAITITYPENLTYALNVSNINYTLDEIGGGCWYSVDLGVTNSTIGDAGTNWTVVESVEGSNNWSVWCNDSLSNEGTASVVFNKDTINPGLTVDYPGNSTYSLSQVDFNVSGTETLDSCNFTLNSWTDYYNLTSFNTSFFTYTNDSIGDGQYTASFECNDTAGNMNNSESVTFVLDTIAPNVTSINAEATSTTVTVTWDTNENANSTLYYGTTVETSSSSSSATLESSHSIYVIGLTAGTSYYYNVSSCDEAANCNISTQSTFSTSAAATTSSTAATGGDGFAIWQQYKGTSKELVGNFKVGVPESFTFKDDAGTGIMKIDITTNKTVYAKKVSFRVVDKPEECKIYNIENSVVYRYIDINSTFKAGELRNIKVEFNVSKSWISANDVNKVYLVECEPDAKVLPTDMINETAYTKIYSSVAPGFSTWAIVGESVKKEVSVGVIKIFNESRLWIIAALIIIIIAVVVYLWRRKRK